MILLNLHWLWVLTVLFDIIGILNFGIVSSLIGSTSWLFIVFEFESKYFDKIFNNYSKSIVHVS